MGETIAISAPPGSRSSPVVDGATPMTFCSRSGVSVSVATIAAGREATAHGSDGVTMAAVAAAGVGEATLFRNFPTRLALLQALYLEDLEVLHRRAKPLIDAASLWDALVSWLRAYAEFSRLKHSTYDEVQRSISDDPELMRTVRESVDSALAPLLERAILAGEVDARLEPADLVQLIDGPSRSVIVAEDRAEFLLGLVLRGIRAER